MAEPGKLSYKVATLANALCSTHVFLDNDDAGRSSYEKAVAEKLIKIADVTLVNCKGMANAEMEDCFEVAAYVNAVKEEYGVDLGATSFKGNAKWSERARKCFEAASKPWGDRVKARLKSTVAEAVALTPASALNPYKRQPFDALVTSLEEKLARAGH